MRASLLASATTTTFLCARAMDQVLAKIAIAAFADAEQARLAAGRYLAGRQSEPRRHVPSTPKGPGVANGGDQRRGVDRPDPGNRHQASHRLFIPRHLDKLFVKDRNTLVEGTPFGAQIFDQRPNARAQRLDPIFIRNLRRPCGATIPRSSSNARKWLISAVRSDTSR